MGGETKDGNNDEGISVSGNKINTVHAENPENRIPRDNLTKLISTLHVILKADTCLLERILRLLSPVIGADFDGPNASLRNITSAIYTADFYKIKSATKIISSAINSLDPKQQVQEEEEIHDKLAMAVTTFSVKMRMSQSVVEPVFRSIFIVLGYRGYDQDFSLPVLITAIYNCETPSSLMTALNLATAAVKALNLI